MGMFRNCFLFNSRESEIYRHAKKLEEKLDQLLQMWLPEFAFDPLTDVVDTGSKSNKRSGSPQAGPSKKKKGARGKENAKRRRNTWIVTTRAIPTVMLQELSICKTATEWGGHGFLDHFDYAPLDSDEDMSKAPSKARGKSGGRPRGCGKRGAM